MAKRKVQYETRQVYASIREELYIAAKSKALELRMPMREFIEHALEKTLNLKDDFSPIPNADTIISLLDSVASRMEATSTLATLLNKINLVFCPAAVRHCFNDMS